MPDETAPKVVLGVMPKWAWDETNSLVRERDLIAACKRYEEANLIPRPEWIKELESFEPPKPKPNIQRLLDTMVRFQVGVNRALHMGGKNETEFDRARRIWYADLTELGIAEMFDWD